MGDKNILHICRECGIVMATASMTAPRKCQVCGAANFSKLDRPSKNRPVL